MYTIEPKAGGGFTLTIPANSIPFGFPTKEAALQHVRSLIGEENFNRATIASRNDGGLNVSFPA